MRRFRIAMTAFVGMMLLAGCGAGQHTSSGEGAEAEPEPIALPESAPDLPDLDELADRGFDCREMPVGEREDGEIPSWFDDQSHMYCVLSDGVIAASWDMLVYDGKVLDWTYFALPIGEGENANLNGLTLAHLKSLQTVFDTLLPQDFPVLGPAMEEWTTPEDTDTWNFEGSQHVSVTGQGLVSFEAVLADIPQSISRSTRTGTKGPKLDPEKFVESAKDFGWSECTTEDRGDPWGHHVACDLGIFHLSMDLRDDSTLYQFSITNFGSTDGAVLLQDLSEVAKASDSEELVEWVAELTEASGSGGEKYVWVGNTPAVIHALDHPDNLRVEVGTDALSAG